MCIKKSKIKTLTPFSHAIGIDLQMEKSSLYAISGLVLHLSKVQSSIHSVVLAWKGN